MANKTSQQLVTRVMQKLTNLPPGEDPSAEDDAFITESWQSINDNLRSPAIKVSSWTYDSIPGNVFEPLCQYVKEMLWEEYHGARDNNTAICEAALNKLRMTVAMPYMGSPQASDDY